MKGRIRSLLLAALIGTGIVACGGSPQTPLLISSNQSKSGGATPAPSAACTVQGQATSSAVASDLTLSGPCNFVDHAAAQCVVRPGDYYVYIHHDLVDGGQFVLTVNVEGFTAPGDYSKAQVNLQITRHGLFYYWSTFTAAVRVLAGETAAVLPKTSLAAEAGTPAQGTIEAGGEIACPSVG